MVAIADACGARIPAELVAVISNEANAAGLDEAARRGIHVCTVAHRAFDSRAAFEHALSAAIDAFSAELVVLAGFMRILTPALTNYASNAGVKILQSYMLGNTLSPAYKIV